MTRTAEILAEWPTLIQTRDPRSRLYKGLTLALELAEISVRQEEVQALNEAILARPATGNRQYIMDGSDIYVRVTRFLYENDTTHNRSRYAVALRRANEQGVSSNTLYQHLVKHGGVNGLTQYNRNAKQLKVCPHCGGSLKT